MKKLIILLFAFVILSQLVEAQRLSITPTMIKETITIDRISNRTLKIENLEDYDVFITSVEISGEIKDIVSVTRKTTYLIPNGNGTMEIKIDTNN
ncbi:MAG: hypothetical protein GTN36_05185, partial [Candidatus Aenigmarchaeota archaeon]|nr:hypothetical protein [Candidatus Aenigmarchaeota archaeon]